MLDELHKQFDTRLKYWLSEAGELRFLQGEVKEKFANSFTALGEKFWRQVFKTPVPAIERRDSSTADNSVERLTAHYGEFRALIDGALPEVFKNIAAAETDAVGEANWKRIFGIGVAGLVAALISGLVYAMFPMIVYPILEVTGLLARLASGNITEDKPSAGGPWTEKRRRKRVAGNRSDEMGQLARAAVAFKQNSLNQLRQSREQEEARQRAVEEGHRLQEEAIARERSTVSDSIGQGLIRLASKDLTYRIDSIPEAYRKLQEDFKSALDQLEEANRTVSGSTETINRGSQEISSASDDLSRRTESQAANIEETAAAVAEITNTVKQTASGAQQARDVVASAREETTKSSTVVPRQLMPWAVSKSRRSRSPKSSG